MSDKLMRIAPQRPEFGLELPSDTLERLIYFARVAPSAHNSQPWKFVAEGNAVDLFADFSYWLKAADPDRRELYLSLGCALETLLIAGDYEGLGVEVRYFPLPTDDGYICRAQFKPGAPKRENSAAALLHAVPKRHTSHRLFEKGPPIGERELAILGGAVDGEEVALHFAQSEQDRSALIDLFVDVEAELFDDEAYRADLARWIGSGATGQAWLKAKLVQFAREHSPAEKLAQTDTDRLMSAPVFAVLSTAHNRRIDQVRAGQAYARAALIAENHGLRNQPFSALTANERAREAVQRIANLGNRHPQLVFRLGHAEPESSRTPRRPLPDIMVKTG